MKTWRLFFGAAVLVAGLMLQYAPVWSVAAGLALAAVVVASRRQSGSRSTSGA